MSIGCVPSLIGPQWGVEGPRAGSSEPFYYERSQSLDARPTANVWGVPRTMPWHARDPRQALTLRWAANALVPLKVCIAARLLGQAV